MLDSSTWIFQPLVKHLFQQIRNWVSLFCLNIPTTSRLGSNNRWEVTSWTSSSNWVVPTLTNTLFISWRCDDGGWFPWFFLRMIDPIVVADTDTGFLYPSESWGCRWCRWWWWCFTSTNQIHFETPAPNWLVSKAFETLSSPFTSCGASCRETTQSLERANASVWCPSAAWLALISWSFTFPRLVMKSRKSCERSGVRVVNLDYS